MNTKNIPFSLLQKIIREEVEIAIAHDKAEEVEAMEDVWSGGENLAKNLDHSAIAGSEEVTSSPETLSIVDDTGVYRMSESKLRTVVRRVIRSS